MPVIKTNTLDAIDVLLEGYSTSYNDCKRFLAGSYYPSFLLLRPARQASALVVSVGRTAANVNVGLAVHPPRKVVQERVGSQVHVLLPLMHHRRQALRCLPSLSSLIVLRAIDTERAAMTERERGKVSLYPCRARHLSPHTSVSSLFLYISISAGGILAALLTVSESSSVVCLLYSVAVAHHGSLVVRSSDRRQNDKTRCAIHLVLSALDRPVSLHIKHPW